MALRFLPASLVENQASCHAAGKEQDGRQRQAKIGRVAGIGWVCRIHAPFYSKDPVDLSDAVHIVVAKRKRDGERYVQLDGLALAELA